MMLIFCLIWANIAYSCATLITAQSSDVKTYPPEWIQKCGDGSGQIPIFATKNKEFEACYKKYTNPTSLIEGFVDAMQNETVPKFVKEKCHEIPEINECLDAYADSIAHCFNEREKTDMGTTVKILKAMLDFICENNGAKVLLFLQEKGFECFESKQLELHACISNTSKDDFTNASLPDDMSFIASISYTPNTCLTINEIYQCFFEALEGCDDRTPSLLLKALNRWILKDTPCRQNTSEGTSIQTTKNFLIPFLSLVTLSFLNSF